MGAGIAQVYGRGLKRRSHGSRDSSGIGRGLKRRLHGSRDITGRML